MGNGMNKILPGLYIGNFKDARDAEQLSKNKVTHILSVHDSARPMLEGVKYLCIPAADSPSQNLTRHFKESIKFIHECRLRGESCLVHCLAGVSRSVTLVIAYIMTVTDFGWEDALHTVRAGRSCANPNVGFQRQLQEFEKHEVHQYRQWLREEYGESPLQDAEEAKSILEHRPLLIFFTLFESSFIEVRFTYHKIHLRSGVRDQPDQQGETPSLLKNTKLAGCGGRHL
ncbi:dual specificity protein phosphatase 22 isoform X1 [Macaca fascicularis]|uniref:dual specificity protein phosphatase 22 isoform X1 n=1 Tax=Macaca fascicularis TaxID=9541 RepID=UPI0032B0534A